IRARGVHAADRARGRSRSRAHVCAIRPGLREGGTAMTAHAYRLKGNLLGACNCDWGCPCSFEARPTKGFCEGSYIWHVEEGHFHGTLLNGSTFGVFIQFPGAPHEGNGKGVVLVDDKVPLDRRAAVEAMIQQIPPFSIFHGLLSTFL